MCTMICHEKQIIQGIEQDIEQECLEEWSFEHVRRIITEEKRYLSIDSGYKVSYIGISSSYSNQRLLLIFSFRKIKKDLCILFSVKSLNFRY